METTARGKDFNSIGFQMTQFTHNRPIVTIIYHFLITSACFRWHTTRGKSS